MKPLVTVVCGVALYLAGGQATCGVPAGETDFDIARQCEAYRGEVRRFREMESNDPENAEIEQLRAKIGDTGLKLLKKLTAGPITEGEILLLLGPPESTQDVEDGLPPSKVIHDYFGTTPDQRLRVYCVDGKVERFGVWNLVIGK